MYAAAAIVNDRNRDRVMMASRHNRDRIFQIPEVETRTLRELIIINNNRGASKTMMAATGARGSMGEGSRRELSVSMLVDLTCCASCNKINFLLHIV